MPGKPRTETSKLAERGATAPFHGDAAELEWTARAKNENGRTEALATPTRSQGDPQETQPTAVLRREKHPMPLPIS